MYELSEVDKRFLAWLSNPNLILKVDDEDYRYNVVDAVSGEVVGQPHPDVNLIELLMGDYLEVLSSGVWNKALSFEEIVALIDANPATAQFALYHNDSGERTGCYIRGVDCRGRRVRLDIFDKLNSKGYVGVEIGPRIRPSIFYKAVDTENLKGGNL